MFGAAAMSVSSVLVVSNALRLNFVKLENKKSEKRKAQMEKIIKIEGMMCPHCENRVKTILEGFAAVSLAEVSHEKGLAKITMTDEIANQDLIKIIEEQGYKVTEIE
jgi:Cu2+-exporting ATPase